MPSQTNTFLVLGGAAALLLIAQQRAKAAEEPARDAAPRPPSSTPERSEPETEYDSTEEDEPGAVEIDEADPLTALALRVGENVSTEGTAYDRALVRQFQTAAGMPAKERDGLYGPKTRNQLALIIGAEAPPVPTKASATAKGKTLKIAPSSAASDADEEHANLLATSPAYREEHALKMMRAKRAAELATSKQREKQGLPPITSSEKGELWPQERGDTAQDVEAEEARIKRATNDPTNPAPINLELARREAPQVAAHIRKKGKLYTRQVLKDFQRHAGIVHDGKYGPKSRSALEHFGVVNPPAPIFPGPDVAYAEPEDANQ